MTGQYTIAYDPVTSKLTVSNNDATAQFTLYPTAWLKANAATWNAVAGAGLQIDAADLRDAGSVTGWATGTTVTAGSSSVSIRAPGVVNCLPYHQLFLRSSLGNGYDAIGPDAQRTTHTRTRTPSPSRSPN